VLDHPVVDRVHCAGGCTEALTQVGAVCRAVKIHHARQSDQGVQLKLVLTGWSRVLLSCLELLQIPGIVQLGCKKLGCVVQVWLGCTRTRVSQGQSNLGNRWLGRVLEQGIPGYPSRVMRSPAWGELLVGMKKARSWSSGCVPPTCSPIEPHQATSKLAPPTGARRAIVCTP
jgi:hypothetical protein